MKKITPREEIKRLKELNKDEGFYAVNAQIVYSLETKLHNQTINIMRQLNDGFLWVDERSVFNKIYNRLLDGVSVRKIKLEFKSV